MLVCKMLAITFSCVCTEPKEPNNSTLQYWQEKNVTSSKIDWLSLDVKVRKWQNDSLTCLHHATPGVLYYYGFLGQ